MNPELGIGGLGHLCSSPSCSKLLKASHQRDLFRFLKLQPQEAQVHLQRALGIETEAVWLDDWSRLPLPDTKETKGSSDFFPLAQPLGLRHEAPPRASGGPFLAPLYLGQLQRGDTTGCEGLPGGGVPRPILGRDRVVPCPPATVLRFQEESLGHLAVPSPPPPAHPPTTTTG